MATYDYLKAQAEYGDDTRMRPHLQIMIGHGYIRR